MTVGFFMGIRPSFIEKAQDFADEYLREINVALVKHNLPEYQEPPPPDVYEDGLFGRCALDHDTASLLASIGKLAAEKYFLQHLAWLSINPYRVAFLPMKFSKPILTNYKEKIADDVYPIAVCSSPLLYCETITLAPLLGIPIESGKVTNSVAAAINDYQPLFPGDTVVEQEEQRTTWLLIHEGARLSMKHQIALSLAG